MKPRRLCRSIGISFLLLVLRAIPLNAANPADGQAVLKRMESAYEAVKDYRVLVRVVFAGENAGRQTEEFIYTFKKPGQVRIDFQAPQSGTIIVFPDEEGKVLVRPWGWRLLDLHLAPDSLLLTDPSGQRVDQTDLGLLIRNMGRSMDGGRQGPLEIVEEGAFVRIRVLAENHFREGKVTRYQFTIDKNTSFPAEIEEWTPDGLFERRITFQKLAINTGVPDSFFRLNDD
jgi:outer membrane lipoprotein-sorting protein